MANAKVGICLAILAVAGFVFEVGAQENSAVATSSVAEKPEMPDGTYQVLMETAEKQLESGSYVQSAQTASKAFKKANSREGKYQAARLASAARLKARHYTRSEWWLRLGANYAPTQAAANQIKNDFQFVRSQNSLSIQLSFSTGPSNNINGGAEDRIFYLDDIRLELPESGLALSGVEYAGSATLGYTIDQSVDHRTSVGMFVYGRSFALSSATKQAVPDAKASDYSQLQLEVSASHQRRLFDRLGPTGISFHTGKTWYGGNELWRYNRISISQIFPVGRAAQLTLRGIAERQIGLASDRPDTDVYGFQGNYEKRMGNLDVLRLSLATQFSDASLETYTNWSHRLSFQYDLAEPVLGTSVSLLGALGYKSYDEFFLSLDGRRDLTFTLGAEAVFNNISVYGFSPTLTVSANKTNSNVSRFTTQGLQASFGFSSNF